MEESPSVMGSSEKYYWKFRVPVCGVWLSLSEPDADWQNVFIGESPLLRVAKEFQVCRIGAYMQRNHHEKFGPARTSMWPAVANAMASHGHFGNMPIGCFS